MRLALTAVLLITVAGCGQERQLVAELRTDLRPGIEFVSVETRVTNAGGAVVAMAALPVYTTTDFFAGQRVIEAHGLASGTHTLALRLLDHTGREVAHRNAVVSVQGTTLVTVLVTRDCGGVVCPPSGGSPSETECLAGRCVRPECVVEDPASCPTSTCASDRDCAHAVSCVRATCVSGACFSVGDDTRCGARQWCDPTLGCRDLDPSLLDGGPVDAGPRDAGGTVADAGLDASTCPLGAACDTGQPCETGRLDCTGACVHDAFLGSSTQCRASAGPCDVPESCSGASADCPADGYRTGTCRGARDACDVAERCDGASAGCPADEVASDGTNCGASWSELSCGPIDVDTCQGGTCVHAAGFDASNQPSCGRLSTLCGFGPGNCCGSGGMFCVDEPGNPIYGSSSDCAQCCRPGRCCLGGNPAGPCM